MMPEPLLSTATFQAMSEHERDCVAFLALVNARNELLQSPPSGNRRAAGIAARLVERDYERLRVTVAIREAADSNFH